MSEQKHPEAMNYFEMEIERLALSCEVRSLYDLSKLYMAKADSADKVGDDQIGDALRDKSESVRKEAKQRSERLKLIESRRDGLLRDAARQVANG